MGGREGSLICSVKYETEVPGKGNWGYQGVMGGTYVLRELQFPSQTWPFDLQFQAESGICAHQGLAPQTSPVDKRAVAFVLLVFFSSDSRVPRKRSVRRTRSVWQIKYNIYYMRAVAWVLQGRGD